MSTANGKPGAAGMSHPHAKRGTGEQHDTPKVDADGALVCPACASTAWTWHEVRVYTGTREDADGSTVTAHGGKAVVGAAPRAWFLGRRDDVRVGVTCECCAAWYDLQVVQHKGAVLLQLVPVKLESGRVYRGDPPGPR